MLDFWYKKLPKHPKDHKDFWRTKLIAHTLLLASCYFVILTLLNIFYFSSYDIALFDTVGLCITLAVYSWFTKTADVNMAAWAVAIIIVSLIMLFVISAGGRAHTLFWATLIPPLTFFLVGRTWGSVLSGIAFCICAYLTYKQQQQVITIGLGSLFNVIEVSIAHIIVFRFYEKTRFSAYQHLQARNIEIQHLAETDKLTGLYNRQKFDQTLSLLLADNKDATTSNSLLICDIDHFKNINDTYGHLAGDNILSTFATVLKHKMPTNSLIARWGGEEFTIILPNTTLTDAAELAHELKQYISEQKFEDSFFTISIGLTELHCDDTVKSSLERADSALFTAKSNGRNTVYYSDNNFKIVAYPSAS
ncbi:GGDEF domain-containing protein [Pseudoalteromonas sp. A601]|uniref:GGDEF domain-containing protein n=1 Tax=Pseudoalteromonas sp. A601 TaxID=1967839 RepID=UPI000B3CCE0A|nr:GGDEF domain-containing protein [Pseudoalteromonas sp. A601]OUS74292.1 GGDEF domain-containing protein [Pseudoalteromonas sp. A601]